MKTRILFVDDEPKALEALRRSLRAYRQQWTMEFCEGAEQALEMIAAEPFDAIVTDMNMPRIDGAELLSRIRDLYPDTARIILGGQSEQDRILRSVGSAHQFLSKPCDPEVLRTTITRVCLLGKQIHNPELKALISRMDSLPSLPDSYYELVEELQKEDASVERIGDLISKDLGMTAKVMQLVNSSFFGLAVHINDAHHAAALLGLNTLKPLVLTASIFRQLEEMRVSTVYLENIFTHSLEVGGIAKSLAKAEGLDKESVDNAFIGGALHDIGKVILADNFGRQYTVLCQQAKAQNKSQCDLEVEQYGTTHADAGGFLLGLWGLPQEILEIVAFHHEPDIGIDKSFSTLTAVYAANLLCARNTAPMENPSAEDPFDRVYLAKLGIQDRVEAWREIVAELAVPV